MRELAGNEQMVRSIDPRRGILRAVQWPNVAAILFGTHVAEPILASVHVRALQQAGHMNASDPIKTIKEFLQGGGRPHMHRRSHANQLDELFALGASVHFLIPIRPIICP